jgi:mRNA interferase MazF
LIIQNDVANQHSSVTIVAAITSKYDERLYPTEVLIPAGTGGLKQDSVVLLNQIRSIDRQRLTKRIGEVEESVLRKVDSAIKISLGLIKI